MSMNNYIILNKRKNLNMIRKMIKELNMSLKLKNKRTMVWRCNDLQISIDKNLIRVLIYSDEDIKRFTKIIEGKYGKIL